MPNRNWSDCGGLRVSAAETLTALIGLEVLFKAFAATDTGHQALHTALDERLEEIDALTACGIDPGPSRHVALILREMVQRVAPAASLTAPKIATAA